MEIEDVHSVAAGEQRSVRGGTESLMVFLNTLNEKTRDAGHSAIEVRFVHQIYRGN